MIKSNYKIENFPWYSKNYGNSVGMKMNILFCGEYRITLMSVIKC
jgi:hypothetical protein